MEVQDTNALKIFKWLFLASALLNIVLLFLLVTKKPEPVYLIPDAIKERQDSLKKDTEAKTRIIEFERTEKLRFAAKVDSLLALPPKFKKEYKNAEKKIDNAYSAQLVYGFDSVFASNGIH